MHDRWPHTGAVLAGGVGRRMGRRKDSLPLPGGRSMLETVAAALAGTCRDVVVVGDAETVMTRIEDLRTGHGPLGGIEALLASNLDTHYLVCPCDLPMVTAAVLRRLTVATGAVATVFHVDGEPDFWPLPARISAGALALVRSHLDGGRRAVHDLVRALDPNVIALPREESKALANVNTPSDYEALR